MMQAIVCEVRKITQAYAVVLEQKLSYNSFVWLVFFNVPGNRKLCHLSSRCCQVNVFDSLEFDCSAESHRLATTLAQTPLVLH